MMNTTHPLAEPAIQEARTKLRDLFNQFTVEDLHKMMENRLSAFKTELERRMTGVQVALEDEIKKCREPWKSMPGRSKNR